MPKFNRRIFSNWFRRTKHEATTLIVAIVVRKVVILVLLKTEVTSTKMGDSRLSCYECIMRYSAVQISRNILTFVPNNSNFISGYMVSHLKEDNVQIARCFPTPCPNRSSKELVTNQPESWDERKNERLHKMMLFLNHNNQVNSCRSTVMHWQGQHLISYR